MKGLIESSSGEAKQSPEHPALQDLPKKIKELFSKLPPKIAGQILPLKEGFHGHEAREEDRALEDIIALMDTEARVRYLRTSLENLFDRADFKEILLASNQKHMLEKEVGRFLDLMWENRGKREKNIRLYNDDFYTRFFKERETLTKSMGEHKAAIANITDTRKKRLTNEQTAKLGAHRSALESLTKSLEALDESADNTPLRASYSKDVESRKRYERMWTEAVVMASEYLTPFEFASIVQNLLDETFHNENRIVKNPDHFKRRVYNEEMMERAEEQIAYTRQIVSATQEGVEQWHSSHQNDSPFKNRADTKREKRNQKLIDFLKSALTSYADSKERNADEREQAYLYVQIETALTMLAEQK